MARIKRFAIERIPIEIKYVRPVLGRLYLMCNLFRFVKFAKIIPTIPKIGSYKPLYRLYIPQFKKAGGQYGKANFVWVKRKGNTECH